MWTGNESSWFIESTDAEVDSIHLIDNNTLTPLSEAQ